MVRSIVKKGRRSKRAAVAMVLCGAAVATGFALVAWPASKSTKGTIREPQTAVAPSLHETETDEEDESLSFRIPTGRPAMLSCENTRRILSEIRNELLAYSPSPITPSALGSGVSDWMDPYELWTASPDSPIAHELDISAADLLREVEQPRGKNCPVAENLGHDLTLWIGELELELDRSRRAVDHVIHPHAFNEALVDMGREEEPARTLAHELGTRLGEIELELGSKATRYVDSAANRFLPSMTDHEWSEVTLASVVRAYVPLLDPHGAWAPNGEESSVYDLDLEAHPPGRAWGKVSRTTLGIRIDEGAKAPLENGDIILEVDGLMTGGLPPEQVDQLAFHAGSVDVGIVRIRAGTLDIDRVELHAEAQEQMAGAVPNELDVQRIAYGKDGDVAVISIADVPDDLGAQFAVALNKALRSPNKTVGVILDLRGNGGGSTEGAIDVLGALLPGAPLFPMKRRDGTLETDRAPPQDGSVYRGPLATLVDAGTASAAEMIAGALGAYHRAPIVGTPTYGKGCAQEYIDDAAHAGVLRLTTLLYALPDGNPVQRTALKPWAYVPFVAAEIDPTDREAMLPHAPPTWSSLDVRDPAIVARSPVLWPEPSGTMGPCKDDLVCAALRTLHSATFTHEGQRGPTARGR